jgi:hypothetical protein
MDKQRMHTAQHMLPCMSCNIPVSLHTGQLLCTGTYVSYLKGTFTQRTQPKLFIPRRAEQQHAAQQLQYWLFISIMYRRSSACKNAAAQQAAAALSTLCYGST